MKMKVKVIKEKKVVLDADDIAMAISKYLLQKGYDVGDEDDNVHVTYEWREKSSGDYLYAYVALN